MVLPSRTGEGTHRAPSGHSRETAASASSRKMGRRAAVWDRGPTGQAGRKPDTDTDAATTKGQAGPRWPHLSGNTAPAGPAVERRPLGPPQAALAAADL